MNGIIKKILYTKDVVLGGIHMVMKAYYQNIPWPVAATTAPSPIFTPGRRMAFAPIQTSFPISTGRLSLISLFSKAALS